MSCQEPPSAQDLTPEALLAGLDRGIEMHLAWTQRLLRCALLHERPDDDMLLEDAHCRCRFGQWLSTHRRQLQAFDATLIERIELAHRQMHDAVRELCEQVLARRPARESQLQSYEQGQSSMIGMLYSLRERIDDAAEQHDVLTGLPLRHNLEHIFQLRRHDAQRLGAQLWVAMIDIDRFKRVNDKHGHAVGDLALQHVARRLSSCMRENDALFRYGGEEFLALLLVGEAHDAQRLAERVLDAVRQAPLELHAGDPLKLSVTIGLSRVGPDDTLTGAVERADLAMLQGKQAGRDRYQISPG